MPRHGLAGVVLGVEGGPGAVPQLGGGWGDAQIITGITVSPAGLEVPPLGPKWGRWAKKTRVRIRSSSLQSAGMG